MKIGKYQIFLGKLPCKLPWFEEKKPSIFRYFLCFTIVEEVDLTSTTLKRKHPLGKRVYHEGREYRYYKK